jgi:hypothetical protein
VLDNLLILKSDLVTEIRGGFSLCYKGHILKIAWFHRSLSIAKQLKKNEKTKKAGTTSPFMRMLAFRRAFS